MYPVPTIGTTTLRLYLAGQAVGQFADLSTSYVFPPGYKDALYLNLARRCAIRWNRPVSSELYAEAADALADVRRANSRPQVLTCGEITALTAGIQGPGWDWRSGDWRR